MREMSEWHRQVALTALAGAGFAADENMRKQFAKRGLKVSTVGLSAVGLRLGIEGAGLAASYAIAGKQGVKDWQVASARMFSWGPVEKIPVIGGATHFIPIPWGLPGILFESGKMIGSHYGPRDLLPSLRKPSSYSSVPDDGYDYSSPGPLL